MLAPKAVLSNWTAEFEKWLGGTCEVLLYDGPADVRKQMVQSHVKAARFNVLLSHYNIAISDKGVLSRVQVRRLSPPPQRSCTPHGPLAVQVLLHSSPAPRRLAALAVHCRCRL